MIRVYLGFLLVSLNLLPSSLIAADEDIVVAVGKHISLEKLSRQQVADIFLDNLSSPELPLKPFDREEFALKGRFYREVTEMSLNRLRAYWSKRVFTGRGRPPKIMTINELLENKDSNREVITYLYRKSLPENMKVVFELPAREVQ